MRILLAAALVLLVFSGCGGTSDRPSRTITIEPNQKVTFEHDAVQTGDTIVCVVDGAPIGAVVPPSGEGVGGVGDPASPEDNAVTINVSNQDETVKAECVVE